MKGFDELLGGDAEQGFIENHCVKLLLGDRGERDTAGACQGHLMTTGKQGTMNGVGQRFIGYGNQ